MSCRPFAVASSVAWLALAGAALTLELEPPHAEEPFAGANFDFVAADFVQVLGDRFRALERCREVDVGDVLRDELVEVDVEVGQDRDRREDHDHAERALEQRAAAGLANAVEQAPAAERQSEQHDGRAERVGDRDHDRFSAGRADRDDGREDRAGAGGVDEAERAADEQAGEEPVAARSRPEARQARERRLDPVGDAAAAAARRRMPSSTTIATSRSGSLPRPTPSTTLATPTIVTVNVTDSPSTMPSGRRRPPTPPAESSAGSTGSTHGDRAVPAPASTAKPSRTIMRAL